MSEFIWIYLYTVLSSAINLGWNIALSALLCFGAFYGFSAISSDMGTSKDKERHDSYRAGFSKAIKSKITIFVFTSLALLTVLIPSESEIKTIIAGGLVWKGGVAATEIEGIDELPENLVKAMNAFLVEVQQEQSEQ